MRWVSEASPQIQAYCRKVAAYLRDESDVAFKKSVKAEYIERAETWDKCADYLQSGKGAPYPTLVIQAAQHWRRKTYFGHFNYRLKRRKRNW